MKRTKFPLELDKKKAERLTDEEWLAMLEKDYPPLAEEVKAGYKTISLQPIKCIKCEHTEFEMKNVDTIGRNVDTIDGYGSAICEYDDACKKCGHINGHWGYGNYCI